MKYVHLLLIVFMLLTGISIAQETGNPSTLPDFKYHLTARPWQELNISQSAYLDKIETVVRAMAQLQNSSGAIIDPYANREVQYATPFFAYGLGTLLSANRAKDLLSKGVAAMNHATSDVAAGASSIPDNHGEFFLAPLTKSISLYAPHVSSSQVETWRNRMKKPLEDVIRGVEHNWQTYAELGEWLRAKQGLVSISNARSWIDNNWETNQRNRIVPYHWRLYHDGAKTFPYDAVARGNLLALVEAGFDGSSKSETESATRRGTQSSLFLQDPTGQAPVGGRSSDHVWNDIVSAYPMEIVAKMSQQEGKTELAGRLRRAASLGFLSVDRWKRSDGSFSVTKNHFNPSSRVSYANYSFFTNYNGYMMYYLSELYNRRNIVIEEVPAPSEVGGYTLRTDSHFSAVFANAGGMQLQANLRGETSLTHEQYWTALGVVRFSRVGWDSRLGPSDGIREASGGQGVSFAPTFQEGDSWVRLASVPGRYEGSFSTQFVHPLLVRCAIDYKPKSGQSGPTFRNEFIITPDGILSTLTSSASNYGVTWPILTYDGKTNLTTNYTSHIASVNFPGASDQQNYIALHSSPTISTSDATRRSAYGDLRPVRMVSGGSNNQTFIYPRSAADPSAESVRTSFNRSGNDFTTVLGRVKGNTYVGRTSAGGVGTSIDLDNDGVADATFSTSCGFILQLENGRVKAVEVDTSVTGVIQGQSVSLQGYKPVPVNGSNPTPTPTEPPLQTFSLSLVPGWNMISLPVKPDNTNIGNVLSGLGTSYTAIHSFDTASNSYKTYVPGASNNTLSVVAEGVGYWIYMREGATLTVQGRAVKREINLLTGWNQVGVPSMTPVSIEQAIASVSGKVSAIYAYDPGTNTYIGYVEGSSTGLQDLEPGRGYWVLASQDVKWTLP